MRSERKGCQPSEPTLEPAANSPDSASAEPEPKPNIAPEAVLERRDDDAVNHDEPVLILSRWDVPWAPSDPDASFKADVALYGRLDPLATLEGLSRNIDVPVGALARSVLAKYATSGSGAALELGPTAIEQLSSFIDTAEAAGTDEARLAAYESLRQFISWLRLPIDQPDTY